MVAAIFIATQLALILRVPAPSYALWAIIAAVGAATVLSYAILAEHFPKEMTGRANGVLNTLHFGTAFVVQWAFGIVVELWDKQDVSYPPIAYQVGFASILLLQLAALLWLVICPRLVSRELPGLSELRVPCVPDRESIPTRMRADTACPSPSPA